MSDDTVDLKVAMAHRQAEAGLGRARLDSSARVALGLEMGDVIEIAGKKSAVAKVFKGLLEDEGKGIIRIDGLTRSNAGVSVDETVRIRKLDPKAADRVVLAPNIPSGKRIKFGEGVSDLFRKGLMNRPLLKGNDILVPNIALAGSRTTFSVVSTIPVGVVTVGPNTEINLREEPSTAEKSVPWSVTYDDVGGLDEELRRIREMIELPLKHPELFDRLGITPPKGVLLYGLPGTGKTLIAKALAAESGASFYPILGPEIMSRYYGQSEERLREIFQEAEENSPSIIFLDEIDSIAPSRDSDSGELERRVVAQLLTLMDGLSGRGEVIVIGATNRENSVDPALRRPGRFDREIELGVPSRKGRRDILDIHLRGMPLTEDVDIDALAAVTQGFVGADLASLAREAAMKRLRKKMPELELDKPIPMHALEDLKVDMDDFLTALNDIEPSGMREVMVEIPKVTWADVGGLEDVKRDIEEVFIPSESPRAYERLGIKPAKGILFYGPPGTGKTLIAKAVANRSGANFISVNGPEIMSKWLGESEKAIRQIFRRAKQMAPCIIFFDELDSIAGVRGREGNAASERVVNQLLTSMDGVESLKNVTVMAATNRPDMIDPALLRPGRFDKMVLIGLPDLQSRVRILEIHSRRMPLLNVDLVEIADRTKGFVGADLESLCREAGLNAYRENTNLEFVEARHFRAALKTVKPSVDPALAKTYEAMSTEMRKWKVSFGDMPLYQ